MHRFLLLLCSLGPVALGAVPPATPAILEPEADDLAYSAADVHMATAPFLDGDGDSHRCSDWEIVRDGAPAWTAPCVSGPSAVHIHLGDGVFADGPLRDEAAYVLRVRHRDDSGDPATEWSAWSERRFRTTPASPSTPMLARDFVMDPAPRWTRTDGVPVALPPGASLRLEAADGQRLLELYGLEIETLPSEVAPLAEPVAVRAVLAAGDGTWVVPESRISLVDREGREHRIFLPHALLPGGVEMPLWVSANGSVHVARAEDRAPDFTEIVRGAPVPWECVEKGYRVERVAEDLRLPVNIAFVPRPRDDAGSPLFYVVELYGDIKVVTRGGQVRDYATGLLNFHPWGGFPGEGETGLTGIAVEPETGDVIVALLYFRAGWTYPRVVRLSSEDGGLTAARVETVLDMPDEQQAPSHQISNVSIGPDGKIYVHMGDTHHAPHAQDMNVMRGKILRMSLDGTAPADNPFYDASDGIGAADYIYALGFRNPFGGAWRAADGMLYEVENGPTTDRFARVLAGFNYGWNGEDESMAIGAVCSFPPASAPVNVAFVQKDTFGGSGFPEAKHDRAFVTESGPTWATGTPVSGKRISEISVRMDGTLESGPDPFLRYNGTGKATVAGIAAGPDGLYFTSLYKDFGYSSPTERGAGVFRVRWTGYADFEVGAERGLHVAFADRSVVADAETRQWDFGDGSTSDERDPVHRYARAGTYLVTLTITRGSDVLVERKPVVVNSPRRRAARP